MPLVLNPSQSPDKSILDLFNRQTYLGQQFIVGAPPTAFANTTENPYLYFSNPTGNSMTCFNSARRFATLNVNDGVSFNFYINPVLAASTHQVQTIALVADSSGSLNNKYFFLYSANDTRKYYVWFNINSAGVDPVIPGYIAIPIVGATNASASTLGTAMALAIGTTVASADFTTGGTSTVTITNKALGPATYARDGNTVLPTGFTFTVTTNAGNLLMPINLRSPAAVQSTMLAIAQPNVTQLGNYVSTLTAGYSITNDSSVLFILDPGTSLLLTATLTNSGDQVISSFIYYELPAGGQNGIT